jgi:hypothetical protein
MYELYNLILKVRVGQIFEIFEFFESIGLHHPLDGVTNPKYKLLRFIQLINFLQRDEGTSF